VFSAWNAWQKASRPRQCRFSNYRCLAFVFKPEQQQRRWNATVGIGHFGARIPVSASLDIVFFGVQRNLSALKIAFRS